MSAMAAEELLQGAWDLHVHAAPDVGPRKQDVVEVARAARDAGMAGVALKDHTSPTAGRCFALNRLFDPSPRFLGCLALNAPVGGLNPVAVESFLREGGRIVFLPTYCAANHIRLWGRGRPPTAFPLPAQYDGISLLDGSGELVPPVHEVIALVKEHDAVLATGHVSPAEGLAALRAAARAGVRRLLATHVSEPVTPYSPAEQAEAVALGAKLEHCYFAATDACPGEVTLADIRDQIVRTGPGPVVLSSDLGQPANPEPAAGFAACLQELARLGVSESALRAMVRDNPARLVE
jgi:hypothetical protein